MPRANIHRLPLKPVASSPMEAPSCAAGFEEVAAAAPADWGAALGFSLTRIAGRPDPRPMVFVATRAFLRERGRPYGIGLRALGPDPSRLILVVADREGEALWALEEALKSGAVCGGLATVEQAAFVATRRLEFAARAGDACGVMLRARAAEDLSAARLRWRIGALPSAAHPLDPRAPGPIRWRAELTRRRDGPPGVFEWEEGDGSHRLRLAARLAGDGLVDAGRAHAAA